MKKVKERTPDGCILLLNAGSSSLKAAAYRGNEEIARCHYDRLGATRFFATVTRKLTGERQRPAKARKEHIELDLPIKDVEQATRHCVEFLLRARVLESLKEVVAVVYRVVHGGEFYKEATILTQDVKERIDALGLLAPLHNPFALRAIETAQRILPGIPHIAVFDTAYHQTLPEVAYRYGIPEEAYRRFKIRKYGFHGTAHKYLALEARRLVGARKTITCHLGNGSSITANDDCRSVDTTMGFTPTDGLIMGTRSGALDPEAVLYLLRHLRASPARIDEFLNHKSGLLGVSELSGDVRDLWSAAQHHKPKERQRKALLALEMLAYHIKQYLGAYDAVLGGADAIVFSGGVGENAWYIRELALDGLEKLGIRVDAAKNRRNAPTFHAKGSKVRLLIVPANEELQMVREARALLRTAAGKSRTL